MCAQPRPSTQRPTIHDGSSCGDCIAVSPLPGVIMNPMLRLAVAFLAISFALSAADRIIVIKAARLFDGKSDRAISPGVIVVTGNKIASVGSSAISPAGAETIDVGDATLLPGFMDAHTHLSDPFER